MPETRYVARFPIKAGTADEIIYLDPGDELDPKDFTKEMIRDLVSVGSALPKDVADALAAAEKAQEAARLAQEEAQRQADTLNSEIMARDSAITNANQSELRQVMGQPAVEKKTSSTLSKQSSAKPS